VHDWLLDYAGSERVLTEILRCLPHAHLFTLLDRMPEAERRRVGPQAARTTFLQRMPGLPRFLPYYLPLMPVAIEQLDVTGYDLVVSSNHAVAKGVIASPDALHVSYVHSPMRYAWDLQHRYLDDAGMARGLRGMAARWLLHRLRLWDHRAAAGVDCFVANSGFIARRILKAYRREAEVIHPPVDIEAMTPEAAPRQDYYVTVGRLMPYKRVDLMLEAFARLPERRLVVIGEGPELGALRARAPRNVELLGWQPEDAVRRHLRAAAAFVFAAVEDFGIAPLEAQACGTPVIALNRGGAAETIAGLDAAAPTGVLFEAQDAGLLAAAIKRFEAERSRITSAACRANAERFSAARFREQFSALLAREVAAWRGRNRAPGARTP
jgi:glycosyltransferase involved in cell wall biosynthesis